MSSGSHFTTSVVGSMPRSAFVRDLLDAEETLDPVEYQRAMDAAVGYIVRLQEHAGLDVVTDGEWRRRSYIGVIAELAHGFELGTNPADGRPWTVVVDRLAPKEPGFIARKSRSCAASPTARSRPRCRHPRCWENGCGMPSCPRPRTHARGIRS